MTSSLRAKRGNPVHFPSLRAQRGNPVPAKVPYWIAASQAPRDDVVIASEAWQSSTPMPYTVTPTPTPTPTHIPHLLIREKKVCGDAGEPMRAVLLGRSGFGVQAVKKPNMIGFKP
jgi:hypothetical protein